MYSFNGCITDKLTTLPEWTVYMPSTTPFSVIYRIYSEVRGVVGTTGVYSAFPFHDNQCTRSRLDQSTYLTKRNSCPLVQRPLLNAQLSKRASTRFLSPVCLGFVHIFSGMMLMIFSDIGVV